ncbi:alpha/beta fold hydrolase [Vibrio sinensis]|uniref:Alpha/beta fold hydrolase n=1 Tax=Vibrio sinensis TaxID=2302434 RepID=A0A3A6QQN8_9VIBR|nr:alpha/beta fold hydrolase [Vibrio sinensis]RJX75230.1 alpha/beta fold hydrolase [Vibrio sinensis]
MKLKHVIGASLAVLSCHAIAQEQRVVIDNSIVGILETPEGMNKGPAVLILHGFMGNKNELQIANTNEGVLERAAATLAQNGIASLRIDFQGAGESSGEFKDTTFNRLIDNANVSLDWLRHNSLYKAESLGLLGWSQGGLVASHVASDNDDVKTTVLWTPVTQPYITYSKLFGAQLIDEALVSADDKVFPFTTSWGVDAELRAQFFKGILNTQSLAAISHYESPLLVIMGKKDDLVLDGSGEGWVKYHPGETKLIEFDTNHTWDVFTGSTTLDELVMPATVQWFNEKL